MHHCAWRVRSRHLLLVVMLLPGCSKDSHSVKTHPFLINPDYPGAVSLLRHERWDEAEAAIGMGIHSTPPGSRLWWDFRLLEVELLLGKKSPALARKLLASDCPPDEPAFARQLMSYRLRLAESSSDESAASNLEEAMRLAEQSQDDRVIALVHLQRARWDIRSNKFPEAEEHLRRVLDYATSHHDTFVRVRALGFMGYRLQQMNQYREAVDWLTKALDEAEKAGLRVTKARSLGNLGYSFYVLGDFDKARLYLSQAETAFALLHVPVDRQIQLVNLGDIEESEGNFDAADKDYREALAISSLIEDKRLTPTLLQNLAVVDNDRRDWAAADTYVNQALALARPSVRPAVLGVKAYTLLGLKKYGAAEEIFKSALQQTSDTAASMTSHSGLAEIYAETKRDKDAEREFRTSIQILEKHQAESTEDRDKLTSFARDMRRFYQEYVSFLISRGRQEEALEVAVSGRGRMLASKLGKTDSRKQRTARELQQIAARSDSTLLVYSLAPVKSYGWMVSASAIHCFELPNLDDLQKTVDEYSEFIQKRRDPLRENNAAGAKLFETLVRPANVTTERVVVAPDGPLYKLNFATLPVSGTNEPHYWIDDEEISIAPSFDMPARAMPQTSRALLLIGNPSIADADFPELNSAGQEMKDIQQNAPGLRPAVFEREKATPEAYLNVRPQQFPFIHFVSHATANQVEPLESAVILARGNSGYRLLASDILKVPLNAELVTISACQSAGAKTYAGEGLVGFSWAFLRSGARNVIAGLWDVDDRSTPQLMADMYRELANGTRPSKALRVAERTMLHKKGGSPKPYYWGAFAIFAAAAE